MKKWFYGWWVLASLFILMMVSIGVMVNCFSLFYTPIIASQHFTYGDFSFTSSIAALLAMAGCLIVAVLIKKIDIRLMISASIVIYAASIYFFSLANTLAEFYIISVFTGLGYAGIGGVAVSQIVTNWFKDRQGLAMAAVMAGSGVGGVIFGPLINSLILTYGWRETFVIIAIIIAVVSLPVAIFVIRLKPGDKGLVPYESAHKKAGALLTPADVYEGISFRQAVKKASFWGLCISNLIAGMLLMAVQMHAPTFIQTVNPQNTALTSTLASYTIAISGFVLIPGKLALGFINDRFGTKTSTLYIFIAYIFTLVSLILLRSTAFAYVFAVMFGLSGAITTVALPLWAVNAFGHKDYATIFAIMSVFMTVGAAAGPPLAGFIFDAAGSYIPAWIALIVIAAAGLAVTLVSLSSAEKAKHMTAL